MKNEQMNNQNGKQDQSLKKTNLPTEADQQKKQDDWTHKTTGKNESVSNNQASMEQSQTSGNEKSNIIVDNEGKIATADKWKTGDANTDSKTPGSDAQKTEKKLPQQGSNK